MSLFDRRPAGTINLLIGYGSVALVLVLLLSWGIGSITRDYLNAVKLGKLPINTTSYIDHNQITLIEVPDIYSTKTAFKYTDIKLFNMGIRESYFKLKPGDMIILNDKVYLFKPEALVGDDLSTVFIYQSKSTN